MENANHENNTQHTSSDTTIVTTVDPATDQNYNNGEKIIIIK